MFAGKTKKKPPSKGQGVATAKQLGLFVDFSPEDMMMNTNGDDDGDLEAELAEITGKKSVTKPKSKGKSPLPMDHIEQMAEECLKDIDDDDDDNDNDNLEDEEELLAELKEMVQEEEEEEPTNPSVLIESAPDPVNQCPISQPQSNIVTVNAGLQNTLEERLQMYRIAISNAKQAGEMSKLRRYERGLKTLQTLLASANKGKKIEEAEIPPPVATGKSSATGVEPDSLSAKSLEDGMAEMRQEARAPANEALLPKSSVTELSVMSSEPEPSNIAASVTSVQSEIVDVLTTDTANNDNAGSDDTKTKVLLVGRQEEYKLAALRAKQAGNITQAKEYMKISKKFDVVIKALDSGEPVDLTNLPPLPTALTDTSAEEKSLSPSNVVTLPEQQGMDSKTEYQDTPESGLPPSPKDVVEALHQRMEKYKTAAAQAKADGNDRKARMHERIVKQYQDAIRAHKAGRKVDFSDLPIPPGFPTIPGVEEASGDHSIVETLETASRLVTPAIEEDEEVTEVESGSPQPSMQPPVAKKPTKLPGHGVQTAEATLILPVASEERQSPKPVKKLTPSDDLIQLSSVAQQQLEFLQNRKKLYMKAAVQAKQKKNLEQAKNFLKIAKGFDPMIVDIQCGKSIDISKVPSPPDTEDDDDDFIIVHHKDVQISETLDEVYTHLMNLLKEQYEKCMSYSKQFIHLGNITETTRFEKMAADCKISMQILKLGQARGSDPPKYHFEERTFKTVRIFSDISSAEMLLIIVKGINLPAPSGVATHDLDAFVKFEFPYPSTEQAQRHKTAVIKNTNCPEYNQRFVLNINRNHRGFKRVIQTKGIKFEIFHKGGFLRSDKSVGTAQLKLDKLETQCEVREIVEIFDGRKSTGGRLELKVQIRDPLNGQDLQINTEKWLVLDPASRSQD
ncbi:coiled-coil and C2 domain-containing protein 1B isoform X2 [Chiloscyllium plagiosum]|uniref:coiled-coil and C2 domain-containing protein 1B isoform X2 n=1 Tax=Chiloscyllium plagiosum TaxID=36176 RepID=UPI001CB87E96|nr:coiled-coil and C2 domain-containing protein 1B isoform X2 [Chiloscyllium plagiosum]